MEGANRRAALAALSLTLALAGCAGPLGTTAASALRKVRESPDPNLRHQAYARLAAPNLYEDEEQKAEATRVLTRALADGKEPVVTRAVICRTLGELRQPAARPAVLKAIDDPEPIVRAAACRALGKVGRPDDGTTLARVMAADTQAECRIAAIEALGDLKPDDPRILKVLAGGMESPEPAVRAASYVALQQISANDLGPDPGPWKALADKRAHDDRPPLPTPMPAAAPRSPTALATGRASELDLRAR